MDFNEKEQIFITQTARNKFNVQRLQKENNQLKIKIAELESENKKLKEV